MIGYMNKSGCKSAVDGLLWEQKDTGSIPVTPTQKNSHYENDSKTSNVYNRRISGRL